MNNRLRDVEVMESFGDAPSSFFFPKSFLKNICVVVLCGCCCLCGVFVVLVCLCFLSFFFDLLLFFAIHILKNQKCIFSKKRLFKFEFGLN